MTGFFAILVTLIIAGAVSGIKVKRGEKVQNKSGLENISRVILYEASVDCKKLNREIFKYCSSKEKEYGCANKRSSTFLFEIGQNGSSLTPLNASDGCYVASYIFSNSSEENVLIVVNGELARIVSPDPPSQENPEANSTKGTETPGTDDQSILGIVVGVIVVGLIVVGTAVCILAWRCRKKSEASGCKKDPKKTSPIERNITAGEQTPGDSFEMVDRISHLEDEDNLKEVLIHDPSVGKENGRPRQNLQHNNSDDDDRKHNDKNSDCDSDFYSNDGDD